MSEDKSGAAYGIWYTPDRKRIFALPRGAVVTPGPLVLESPAGRRVGVTEAEVVPHEVTGDPRSELVGSVIAGALGELTGALDGLGAFLQQARTELGEGGRLRRVIEQLEAESVGATAPGPPDAPSAANPADLAAGLQELARGLQRAADALGGPPIADE